MIEKICKLKVKRWSYRALKKSAKNENYYQECDELEIADENNNKER